MRGRLEAVESVLSGRKATQKKKLSFVFGTTGTGTVSSVYTVYTVVGFPKTTDAPNPEYDQIGFVQQDQSMKCSEISVTVHPVKASKYLIAVSPYLLRTFRWVHIHNPTGIIVLCKEIHLDQ